MPAAPAPPPRKPAASVCSGVRVVLVAEPICLTSRSSRAHLLLPNAGGPSGRNSSAERRLNGRIDPGRGRSAACSRSGSSARDRRVRRRVGHRRPEAVVGPLRDEEMRDPLTHPIPAVFAVPIRNRRQRRRVRGVDDRRRLTRQVVRQGAMRGRGYRRLRGSALGCVDIDRERPVAALDRHHGVVHRHRHVGEDRVPFRGRQGRRRERLRTDGVPSSRCTYPADPPACCERSRDWPRRLELPRRQPARER